MPRYKLSVLIGYPLAGLPSAIGLVTGTSFEITDYGGNIATVVNGVWRFEYPFRTTWSGRPAVGLVPVGTELQVTDYGNQKFINDGSYWKPAQGKVLIYSKWASLTSPIAVLSGMTSGVFSLPGGSPKIPAGMIPPNSKLSLQLDARKIGGNATAIFYAYLGTAGSIADSVVLATSVSIGTNMDICITAAARFGLSKTSFNSRTWLGDGTTSASSANVIMDRTTLVNTDADMLVTFGVGAASAADAFNIIGCSLMLEA